ncbi:hypothetical protein [Corynebacterium senegalense]|uniref:hypothetical protein n=1 Tax=Corynebacterium senegalense TaxID=2080750 RepID=UPI000E1FE370|nr:hypothetical protein [Corynebacterium senegalense]
MPLTTLSAAEVVTARVLARRGVTLLHVSTLLHKPYAEVFAAVRGLDYPYPVMGQAPVNDNGKDTDPWP